MIGAGRDRKEDSHRSGRRRDSRSQGRREGGRGRGALPPLLHQRRARRGSRRDGGRRFPHFRATKPEERELILKSSADSQSIAMGRFTGLLGLLVDPGGGVSVFRTTAAPSSRASFCWGLGLQFAFAFLVLKTDFGKVFQVAGAASTPCWTTPKPAAQFVFGTAGRQERAVRRGLRVSGAADRHLHRFVLLDSLLPRRHAGDRARHGGRDAEGDGRERRGIAERRGQHLHGPDRSAADHPAVPRRA